MRESKRTEILDAAARVVQRVGVSSVTFDSVAEESGLTKGGLMYHFPTRESLIAAIHQHLAGQWEAEMIAVAGKSASEATEAERLRAYVRLGTHSAQRAELLFMLEGATDENLMALWNGVYRRWTPPVPSVSSTDREVAEFVARLASDGLWMYESLTAETLDPALRLRVTKYIENSVLPEA
ncbi:TetR family transcriptional regulator [Rhodococcus sp. 05-339-2]|uniref:TetR/AcrR family transcriptional regulator n=1 Tax=Rhodococcoides fascians TaxID=1828 RepID=UPI00050C8C91|nr:MULTISPECIES: TetR family transcriptional regulator [Rhodococcus]OZD81337.1 TetR family transcriptional regulator [Rhodococcus sp. 05-339-2]